MTLPVRAQESLPPKGEKVECTGTFLPGCQCFSPPQLKIIANGIQDLKKCEFALIEKERLIQEDLIKFKQKSDVAWWQEPNFVAGGVVLSFGLGLTLGVLFIRK